MGLKVHSFNLIESYLREGYFNKLFGRVEFGLSADTLGYTLAKTTLRQFSEINDSVIKKARYGKVLSEPVVTHLVTTADKGMCRLKHYGGFCTGGGISKTRYFMI